MNHFWLKFNHGVEIGAELAYRGHFKRTGDFAIQDIAIDELRHQKKLELILEHYNEKPSLIIDMMFYVIGSVIQALCLISPKFLLNLVAKSLEIFAVVSYANLAIRYSEFRHILIEMADNELSHELYFK